MIEVSPYELRPLRRLNAKGEKGARRGLYIRARLEDGQFGYADYFPHPELGDLSVEAVLRGERSDKFKLYWDKCLWFARRERELGQRELSSFKNHYLGLATDVFPSGATVKLKIFSSSDVDEARQLVRQGLRLRLDANGTISIPQWRQLLDSWSKEELAAVDYIEDPGEGDWTQLPVPAASDFMLGNSYEYVVYKANAQFCKLPKQAVFSSYMGSDLGRYHCYLELNAAGDLDLVHGIHTPGLYQEQGPLFLEEEAGRWSLNRDAVDELYAQLEQREWTCLS